MYQRRESGLLLRRERTVRSRRYCVSAVSMEKSLILNNGSPGLYKVRYPNVWQRLGGRQSHFGGYHKKAACYRRWEICYQQALSDVISVFSEYVRRRIQNRTTWGREPSIFGKSAFLVGDSAIWGEDEEGQRKLEAKACRGCCTT